MIRNYRLSAILSSIVMVGVGLLLLIKPELSLRLICYAAAVIVFVFAVTKLIEYFRTKNDPEINSTWSLISAAFTALIGIFLVIRPTSVSQVIPIVLGVIVLFDGVIIFGLGMFYKKFLPKKGGVSIALGVICIILGLVCSLHSFETQFVLIQFIGASMLISGLVSIVNHIMCEKAASAKEDARSVRFTTTPNDEDDTER